MTPASSVRPGEERSPHPEGDGKARRRARQRLEKIPEKPAENDDAEDSLTALEADHPGHQLDRLA
jgi:hypothetical protein